ncbi:hypothetical protein EW145_g324 [Phellinidium pouzarii]|uniref:Brl1/Brr6 domain-containing protein n=1 Tax=Phellinidium pouzarii TaxID=167371 RepID=A0A4S4LIM9_9AGAM|nr:hypothetical protein EW145_g324 [Phellinidium pouzarii]
MPLVVPLLRFLLLFLNVFETFKTLKPPQRSARTGERTVRALSQRKRDMKGCMAIWLVWCSYSVMEGFADNTIGILMPFYNEIKAVIYLFQILTRARGAEPIYLHVMRPLVKPYVATLDWALELIQMVGDFVMLILSLPFSTFSAWWKPATKNVDAPGPEEFIAKQQSERAPKSRIPSNGSTVDLRKRGSRHASNGLAVQNAAAGPSKIARLNGFPHSKSDATANQKHKVWRPPADAYEHDENYERPQYDRRVVSDSAASTRPPEVESSIPPVAVPNEAGGHYQPQTEEWRRHPQDDAFPKSSDGLPSVDSRPEIEEWRQYPPFPSAYPVTPQVVARTIGAVPSNQRQSALDAVAEQEHYMQQQQQQPEPQLFIPQLREQRVRAKAPGGSGDITQTNEERIDYTERAKEVDEDVSMEVDEAKDETDMDEEDDDDDFNVTLRTPSHLRTKQYSQTRTRSRSSSRSSSPTDYQGTVRATKLLLVEDRDQMEVTPSLFLTVPANARRRANSNNTLSSMRATRTDSDAGSLTTASAASSTRTMSREPSMLSGAPSLASRTSSGRMSGDDVSDTNSVAGVKRPWPAVDNKVKVGDKNRPVKKSNVRPASRELQENIGKTSRVRPLSVRPSPGSIKAGLKLVAKGDRRKPSTMSTTEASDTLDSADETSTTSGITLPAKKRKVKKGEGATGRLDRLGYALAQIPEEKSADPEIKTKMTNVSSLPNDTEYQGQGQTFLQKLNVVFHGHVALISTFALCFILTTVVFASVSVYVCIRRMKSSYDDLEAAGALFTEQAHVQINSCSDLSLSNTCLSDCLCKSNLYKHSSITPRSWINTPMPVLRVDVDLDSDSDIKCESQYLSSPVPFLAPSTPIPPPAYSSPDLLPRSVSPLPAYSTIFPHPTPYAHHMLLTNPSASSPLDEIALEIYLARLRWEAARTSSVTAPCVLAAGTLAMTVALPTPPPLVTAMRNERNQTYHVDHMRDTPISLSQPDAVRTGPYALGLGFL